jgi:hypothetical protein
MIHVRKRAFARRRWFKHTMHIVNPIDTIRRQMTTPADATVIRGQLLDLLFESLKARKDTWGIWERVHFNNAITALTLNFHASDQPSHAWLEVCLTEVEKAITPQQLRDPNYCIPDGSIRKARHEQLMDAVESLRRELEAPTFSNAKAA